MELFRVSILGVVAVANIGLAMVVYLRNSRNRANRAFAAAVLAILCWIILNFMGSEPLFASSSLLLNRATPAAGMLMGTLLLYFAIVFPQPSGRLTAWWWAFFGISTTLMAATVLSDLVVAGVTSTDSDTTIVYGPLFPVFAAWAFTGVLTMVTVFYRKFRRAEGRLRTQVRYMLLGAALFAVSALVFGLLIPLLTGWHWFSQLVALSSILLVGFTAYAMARHRLMDVRAVVLRSVAYTVLVATVGAILLLPAAFVRANSASPASTPMDAAFLILGLVAVFAFQPVRSMLERTTDGLLYRQTYDPDRLLSELGTLMSTTLDITDLASLLAQQLAENMRLSFAAVAYLHCDSPVATGAGVVFTETDARRLLALCRDATILVADDEQDRAQFAPLLAEYQVRVLAPLVMDGIVLGAIILGPKKSGEMYSVQDLKFIEIMHSEASIAMKNAHLFDEKTQRVRELTALNDLAYALGANIELESVLDAAMEQVVIVTAADSGSIMLLDPEDMILSIAASRGMDREVVAATRAAVGEGIGGWVAKSREALILVGDTDPRFTRDLKRDNVISAISAPIICKDSVIGVLNVNRIESTDLFTRANLDMVKSFAGQMAVVIENARLYRELENTILGTIEALAAAVDAKDPYTFGHSTEVTDHCLDIAERLNLSDVEKQRLRVAATLHDIGKIGVNGEILNKPGRLSDEEFAEMRRHPTIGADILASLDFVKDAVPFILFHHERFGGGGYPSGVSGEAIPLGARIIAVADSYNAMTSDRPYRKGMSSQEAHRELVDNVGTQFDPDVVTAFLEVLGEGGSPHQRTGCGSRLPIARKVPSSTERLSE